MLLNEFDYELPKQLIAQKPPGERQNSRLMVLNSQLIDDCFRNLPDYLSPGDVLVLNDSRVVMCKLTGKKETGGRVSLLLLNFQGREASCLIQGRKLKEGAEMKIGNVRCHITKKDNKFFNVEFDEKVSNLIERFGEVPLPFYIKEQIDDPLRYQTVYARNPGSIAAPTAGLHFTENLIRKIKKKGVKIAYLTLHIGPSTFLPITRDEMDLNKSLPEHYSIDQQNSEIINQGIEDNSLIAVGTSTVKALESASSKGMVEPGSGSSDLFISPGYKFKVPIKGMITNFHLPRSSLLLLVSALFGRDRIMGAYSRAISAGYRFYSFGDAMFITG
jgi:S-adenosylmethionine:tRNA ribosyltransferase-isomerase